MTLTIALPLLGAALILLRAFHVIRWHWWICAAPVFAVPVIETVLSVGVAGCLVVGVLFVAELVTGKRAPFWNESEVLR